MAQAACDKQRRSETLPLRILPLSRFPALFMTHETSACSSKPQSLSFRNGVLRWPTWPTNKPNKEGGLVKQHPFELASKTLWRDTGVKRLCGLIFRGVRG